MTSAQYSIGVSTNRFELFDLGDEDPLELIKKQETEREAKKKAKLSEKDVKPKAPVSKGKIEKKAKEPLGYDGHKTKDESVKSAARDERKSGTDFKSQRSNYRGSQDDREKENYRSREDQDRGTDRFQQDDNGFKKGNPEFGRTRGTGRGGPGFRGRTFQRGGGGRSYPPGEFKGKREFDRQSGSNRTGVKSVEKRDGTGNFNWGNSKEDDWNQTNEEELNSSNDKENWDSTNNEHNLIGTAEEWSGPTENTNWGDPESANNNEKGVSPDVSALVPDSNDNPETATENETPKEELTLDEWKAKKGPKVAPSYNLRKAGEGEDLTQWKKMYALRKKKEGGEDDDEEYEYIDYPQRVGRQRHILDIDIRYKDTRGSNTGRGRGRGRGGGFKGNQDRIVNQPRETVTISSAKEVPKVDDEHDFPSLG